MRKIAQLTNVPRDDEFNITGRADKLANDYANLRRTEEGGPKANGTDGKEETPAGEEPTTTAAPAAAEASEKNGDKPAADEKAADESAADAEPKEDESKAENGDDKADA